MANIEFKAIVPQLVVPDVQKTAEYYRDVLGFEILGYFLDPPVYSMVRRGEVELHFGKSDSGDVQKNEAIRKGLGTDVNMIVSDIKGLHDELSAAGANIIRPPIKRIYGSIEFEILDCDNHKIVFSD
jgi:catechol 2,3-dioxygenase-like lactoylglutathione lyase family enzyme